MVDSPSPPGCRQQEFGVSRKSFRKPPPSRRSPQSRRTASPPNPSEFFYLLVALPQDVLSPPWHSLLVASPGRSLAPLALSARRSPRTFSRPPGTLCSSLPQDVLSPPWHSEFVGPAGLMQFLMHLRKLSKRPTGFKMCVGQPSEAAAIIKALQQEMALGNRPVDFITVDGGEGGTGAAPVEFSNRVGTPLREGLVLVDDLLRGAGIRDEVKVIASGKMIYGFSVGSMLIKTSV